MYHQYLDSAEVKLSINDPFLAKYYAKLAQAQKPDFDRPRQIISMVEGQINMEVLENDYIQQQLWISDSLMSYSRYNEAISILEDLLRLNKGNERIKFGLKKHLMQKLKRITIDKEDSNNEQIRKTRLSRICYWN